MTTWRGGNGNNWPVFFFFLRVFSWPNLLYLKMILLTFSQHILFLNSCSLLGSLPSDSGPNHFLETSLAKVPDVLICKCRRWECIEVASAVDSAAVSEALPWSCFLSSLRPKAWILPHSLTSLPAFAPRYSSPSRTPLTTLFPAPPLGLL